MQRQIRWGLVMMSVVCSPALATQPYLSDMIKKPAYARALKGLLDHAGNLPNWTGEILKLKGNYVGDAATHVAISGTTYEVFFTCQPHNCDDAELAVMFAPNGTQAWGVLFQEGAISYLGAPSEAQQAALKKELSNTAN